jgi:hypothetical protein
MARQHPGLVSVTIQGQGHAPLLRDKFSQRIIADFLRDADMSAMPRYRGAPRAAAPI